MNVDLQSVEDFFRSVCATPEHPAGRFWREYWLETGHLARLLRMLGILDPFLTGKPELVDVGGFGELPLILRKFYDLPSRAVSLEGDHIGFGNGRLLPAADPAAEFSIRIDQCDVEREPLGLEDASVDLVTCFEVLEHFRSDPMFALLEFHRVLRPGGALLLSTPNANCWESLARVAAFEPPFTFSTYFADGSGIGHCKEYSVGEFSALFENAGYSLERLETLDVLPPSADLASRYADLAGFVAGCRWWQPELRRQTLFAVARKAARPKMRKYMPLYTENFTAGEHPTAVKRVGPSPDGAPSALQREIDKLRGYIADLKGEIDSRTRWALSLEQESREHRQLIAGLEQDFDERGRWAQGLDAEVARQRLVIAGLQKQLEELEVKSRDFRWLLRRLGRLLYAKLSRST